MIIFHIYNERSSVSKLKKATSEILQSVYGEKSFSRSKAERFQRDIGGKRKNGFLVYEEPLLLQLNPRAQDKVSG